MNMIYRKLFAAAVIAIAAIAVAGCGSELTDNTGPIELVVTNTQTLRILDVGPTTDPDCAKNIGTINMQAIFKRPHTTTSPLTQVRVTRYRVSYRRSDGGTLVPGSFVRSVDTLVGVGGTPVGSAFTVLEADAFTRAPFVALLPQNGGRDPETGRLIVKMEVVVEVFGETIGGENVYDATTFPLDFCYGCGCA